MTLLRSMPPTIGLVVGARGELSRSAKQFVSDCAEKGLISLERFGCCHGQEQARGMIANFINRAFGRVCLRGVARVRHVALTAARGSKYATGHSTSTGMWGGENARDSTGDRAQGGFTSPVRAGVSRFWDVLGVDDAVNCPVEVPAWLMGLCGFLGDQSCGMPRGAVIGVKGAGCDWAPCFSHHLNEI